jgi:hypothetical protein
MRGFLFVVGAFGAFGCQKYAGIPNSGADRIWMVTQDGTEVFRCWDLRNRTGRSIAMCRHAEMVGKDEDTVWSRMADGAVVARPAGPGAIPSHPDNTEAPAAVPVVTPRHHGDSPSVD